MTTDTDWIRPGTPTPAEARSLDRADLSAAWPSPLQKPMIVKVRSTNGASWVGTYSRILVGNNEPRPLPPLTGVDRARFVVQHLPELLDDEEEPRLVAIPASGHSLELVRGPLIVGYATWHEDLQVQDTGASCLAAGCEDGQLSLVRSTHPEDRAIAYAAACSSCSWRANRPGLRVVTV